jgi:hypothetical protein
MIKLQRKTIPLYVLSLLTITPTLAERRIYFYNLIPAGVELVINVTFCKEYKNGTCVLATEEIRPTQYETSQHVYPTNILAITFAAGGSWYGCYGRIRDDDLRFSSFVFKQRADFTCYYEIQTGLP